jgi:hypothetical protein
VYTNVFFAISMWRWKQEVDDTLQSIASLLALPVQDVMQNNGGEEGTAEGGSGDPGGSDGGLADEDFDKYISELNDMDGGSDEGDEVAAGSDEELNLDEYMNALAEEAEG